MNTNRVLTRRGVAIKMGKSTLSAASGSTSENQNKKRSREDLDKTEEQEVSYDSLLVQIKRMIDEGNAKIEKTIETSNNAVVCEISTLRDEVHQLKADYARDFNWLSDSHTKMELNIQKNKDSINRLSKSNDLILTGVPYIVAENTDVVLQKVSVALGYCDSDAPIVRLTRSPIVAGTAPPILLQFAFRASRDEFFRQYFIRTNFNLSQFGYEVDKRVYINENLTETARQIKGIALKLKHSAKIHHVFSKEEIIFVKPTEEAATIPIYHVNQLTEYGSKINR